MDRYPVLFRCDATPETGWESLYQCLTYAAALQRRRRGTYFLGSYAPFPILPTITRGGNEYLPADHPLGTPEDALATIRAVRKYQAAVLVVAGNSLSADYLREVRSAGALLIQIDPTPVGELPSRVLIDPLPTITRPNFTLEPGAQYLAGERYGFVRSIFRRQRPMRSLEPIGPMRALLAFGDNDFADQTWVRAKELLGSTRIEKISTAIRVHHPRYDELRELARESGNRLEILTESNELATRLLRAHFAITSGDNWSLEMACVGIPQLILSQEDRHHSTAKYLDDQGAATFVGDARKVSPKLLHDTISYLTSDHLEKVGMSRCAKQRIDGRGQDRIVTALEIMLHTRSATGRRRVAA